MVAGKPALGGYPSDPQIAVSSKYVVVGVNDRLFFYTKKGLPYPSGANSLLLSSKSLVPGLFQRLINGAGGPKLGLTANGQIDNFSDLRVIFDPYRKRFWVAATGACRTQVDTDGDGAVDTKCAMTFPEKQKRMVIGLAVSVDEDPTHGWILYWWDAAIGWGSNSDVYVPGDLGDYPTLGVNATTIDVSIGVLGTKGLDKTGRAYPHVAFYRAKDMAEGKGPTIPGWHLFPIFNKHLEPLPNAKLTCKSTGLTIPGTASCPDGLIQTTFAHPDPGASYLVSAYPGHASSIVVWKVSGLSQDPPAPVLKGDIVNLPFSWKSPKPSTQQGGSPSNTIDMSIGHPGVPLKSVWAKSSLFLVSPDADATGRATFRILRLPTPGDNGPFALPEPPAEGALQINVGQGSTQSYGWPAIEVNEDGNAVIVYTLVGSSNYASIRYNAWLNVGPGSQPQMQDGRILKAGEATLKPNSGKPSRWADLAGASVDFENGKEAPGIWIALEYARRSKIGSTTNGKRALWVGKIFGTTYP
jgi:hypothetical protein